jgi:hypothetical protein
MPIRRRAADVVETVARAGALPRGTSRTPVRSTIARASMPPPAVRSWAAATGRRF